MPSRYTDASEPGRFRVDRRHPCWLAASRTSWFVDLYRHRADSSRLTRLGQTAD